MFSIHAHIYIILYRKAQQTKTPRELMILSGQFIRMAICTIYMSKMTQSDLPS